MPRSVRRAGIGAICNSMAVLFTASIAFLFYGEKIGLRRAAALFAGFAGVVVLASAKTAGVIGLAVAAGTGAALLYGIGANLIRSRLGSARRRSRSPPSPELRQPGTAARSR